MPLPPDDSWFVYIIESDDNRLYTGITNNLLRRWRAHSSGRRGARFFRGRKPRRLVYFETGFDRSGASRREAEIKRLQRQQKLRLVASQNPEPGQQTVENLPALP